MWYLQCDSKPPAMLSENLFSTVKAATRRHYKHCYYIDKYFRFKF
jgi:hypothetical protein